MPEQLPSTVYAVGGQLTLSGWVLPENQYGFDEDGETKTKANGSFNADITYSRRQTLSVTIEAETGTDPTTYQVGGQIASGTFAKADGSTATAWKIRNSTLARTRGPVVVTLDLIALSDEIT